MFCINYCIATHSMVEIAGRLSQSKDRERLRILKKAACNPNNGQDVYFAGYDYRNHAAVAPEICTLKPRTFHGWKERTHSPFGRLLCLIWKIILKSILFRWRSWDYLMGSTFSPTSGRVSNTL